MIYKLITLGIFLTSTWLVKYLFKKINILDLFYKYKLAIKGIKNIKSITKDTKNDLDTISSSGAKLFFSILLFSIPYFLCYIIMSKYDLVLYLKIIISSLPYLYLIRK
tara:strand:- start:326 stop:649 length:324 start_codon:yes stop_codon:yes gene_type:complete